MSVLEEERTSQRHGFEEPNVQEIKHGRHIEAREVALCLERRHLLGQQLDVRREVLELSVWGGERIERCSREENKEGSRVSRYPNRSIGEADDGELVARVHLVLQVHEPERGRQVRPKCHDRAVARGKWCTCILSMCLTRSSREKVFLRDLGRGHASYTTPSTIRWGKGLSYRKSDSYLLNSIPFISLHKSMHKTCEVETRTSPMITQHQINKRKERSGRYKPLGYKGAQEGQVVAHWGSAYARSAGGSCGWASIAALSHVFHVVCLRAPPQVLLLCCLKISVFFSPISIIYYFDQFNPISAATSKMAKMLTNLRNEVSRRGVLGTLMAWHRGYLRPGVNSVLVGTDERGNRYFEATELPFGTYPLLRFAILCPCCRLIIPPSIIGNNRARQMGGVLHLR